ncbi:MAG TPA: RES family NAD+ phosphorylase [Gaiellaceae bacterium]
MATSSVAAIPPPPDPFDPLAEVVTEGMRLWRAHPLSRPADSFNPTDSSGRFRPIRDTRNPARTWVPTAYVGDSEDGAISEGPFHDLDVTGGPKHLPRSVVDTFALTPVVCGRDLRVVSLRGHGMRRVGATQGTLIEPGPPAYRATAAWGQAAYDASFDGLLWVSRQFPGGLALIVFARTDKPLKIDGPTLPLASGKGFELLCAAANAAGVVIAEP